MSIASELLIKIKADLGNVVNDLGAVEKGIEDTGKAAKKSGEQAKEFGKETETSLAAIPPRLKLLGAGFAVAALGFTASLIRVKSETQALKKELDRLTGNGDQAFDLITDQSRETGFAVEGLKTAFLTLRDGGINPTASVLDAFTNQIDKLGGGQSELTDLTETLADAYAKASLSADDLFSLADQGIAVFSLLEKATGKNSDELIRMAVNGDLGRESIDKIIATMGELTQGSSAEAVDTLGGQIDLLSKAWHNFEDTLLNDKVVETIQAIVGSATRALNLLSRTFSSTIDDQIAKSEARIKNFNNLGTVGQFFAKGGALGVGFDVNAEQAKVDALKTQQAAENAATEERLKQETIAKDLERGKLERLKATVEQEKELEKERQKNARETASAVEQAAKQQAAASARAAAAYQAERQAVAGNIEQLQFELNALQLSSEERAIQIRLRSSAANATDAERQTIENIIRAIDSETAAQKRRKAEADKNKSDDKERAELAKYIDDLSFKVIGIDEFERGIERVALALTKLPGADKSLINDTQAKEYFDQLGKSFNESFVVKANEGVNELSQYGIQAARNMQSAFADFLFDPFEKGMDGLLESFIKTMARMAAEAASGQIFDALLGKDGKDGLLKTGISAIGSFLGGFFHNGGIVGHGGTTPIPLMGAMMARSYHSGGIAGLMPDETYAKLRVGEEVLTRDDPRHRFNQSKTSIAGDIEVTTHVTVSGGSGTDPQAGNQLGGMINSAVRKILVDEKRPGGLLASGA